MPFKTLLHGFITGLFLLTVMVGCGDDHGHSHETESHETEGHNTESHETEKTDKSKSNTHDTIE
ncbi:MAG: hypothetical protein COB30_002860 [Ectothiorhodospiraceae bacterium]|nr:hypothetical protein [Ectothiorhodospiraceae bacterium]